MSREVIIDGVKYVPAIVPCKSCGVLLDGGPHLYSCRLVPKVAPAGFVLTGDFRKPKAGEFYLSHGGGIGYNYGGGQVSSRWILKKIKPRRWVFEETGEERPPQKGEWFADDDMSLLMAFTDFHMNLVHRRILRLVEKPE